jgi:thiol-disulfide isomerase/thioredoxin
MSVVYEITKKEEFSNLLNTYQLVVVDIYADWCSPCKMLAPKYDNIAKQYSSPQVIFCKSNAEAGVFTPQSLPSIEFWVKGKQYDTVIGADVKKIVDTLVKIGAVPNNQAQAPAQAEAQPSSSFGIPATAYRGKNANNQYKTYASYSEN